MLPKSPNTTTSSYLTVEGAKKFRSELQKLLNVDRPEVVRVVSWAASNGDRSENGDYLYGKRKLREIDRRIRFLQKLLERSTVVDHQDKPLRRVVFGAWVFVFLEDSKQWIRIVGGEEIGEQKAFVSYKSPLAQAILGKEVGDETVMKAPKGDRTIEILDIQSVCPRNLESG